MTTTSEDFPKVRIIWQTKKGKKFRKMKSQGIYSEKHTFALLFLTMPY